MPNNDKQVDVSWNGTAFTFSPDEVDMDGPGNITFKVSPSNADWKFTSFCIVASESDGTCQENSEFSVTNNLPGKTMVVKDDHTDTTETTYHYKICTDIHGCSDPKIVNREA